MYVMASRLVWVMSSKIGVKVVVGQPRRHVLKSKRKPRMDGDWFGENGGEEGGGGFVV